MFNGLRNKITTTVTKIKTVRNPQPKFVNPYAMSETVTQQLQVKPEFKDGRFILKPQSDDPRKENIPPEVPKEEPKKPKEPGLLKFVKDVVVSDMEKLAGQSRKKLKRNPVIKKEDVIELRPPAIEPEVIEPEIIETSNNDSIIERCTTIDIEAINIEEENDRQEIEMLVNDVDLIISKSKHKRSSIPDVTSNYVKTALERAEAYKRVEGDQS